MLCCGILALLAMAILGVWRVLQGSRVLSCC